MKLDKASYNSKNQGNMITTIYTARAFLQISGLLEQPTNSQEKEAPPQSNRQEVSPQSQGSQGSQPINQTPHLNKQPTTDQPTNRQTVELVIDLRLRWRRIGWMQQRLTRLDHLSGRVSWKITQLRKGLTIVGCGCLGTHLKVLVLEEGADRLLDLTRRG
ncbi:expressed unknown protein [Seminavis robusta]|uniref:Uncharacterized protein n=1 Tax=Seminavis robusta TaxID=568900 RepID=A0A9N8DSC2_9STRA|nr:expressed unknown protein [Seminavis robusta]|eukprot:Sro321_g116710.1 n/a (160) ;mRNA; f:28085-28564